MLVGVALGAAQQRRLLLVAVIGGHVAAGSDAPFQHALVERQERQEQPGQDEGDQGAHVLHEAVGPIGNAPHGQEHGPVRLHGDGLLDLERQAQHLVPVQAVRRVPVVGQVRGDRRQDRHAIVPVRHQDAEHDRPDVDQDAGEVRHAHVAAGAGQEQRHGARRELVQDQDAGEPEHLLERQLEPDQGVRRRRVQQGGHDPERDQVDDQDRHELGERRVAARQALALLDVALLDQDVDVRHGDQRREHERDGDVPEPVQGAVQVGADVHEDEAADDAAQHHHDVVPDQQAGRSRRRLERPVAQELDLTVRRDAHRLLGRLTVVSVVRVDRGRRLVPPRRQVSVAGVHLADDELPRVLARLEQAVAVLEVPDGVAGSTLEQGTPATPHDDHLVEQGERVGGRRVDHNDDGRLRVGRPASQDADQVGGGRRVLPGRALIKQDQAPIGDQLLGQRQASAFPAGQAGAADPPDPLVGAVHQRGVGQGQRDGSVDLRVGGAPGQARPRAELDRLPDGLLGQRRPIRLHLVRQQGARVGVPRRPARLEAHDRPVRVRQALQQRRLAAAGRADDGGQRADPGRPAARAQQRFGGGGRAPRQAALQARGADAHGQAGPGQGDGRRPVRGPGRRAGQARGAHRAGRHRVAQAHDGARREHAQDDDRDQGARGPDAEQRGEQDATCRFPRRRIGADDGDDGDGRVRRAEASAARAMQRDGHQRDRQHDVRVELEWLVLDVDVERFRRRREHGDAVHRRRAVAFRLPGLLLARPARLDGAGHAAEAWAARADLLDALAELAVEQAQRRRTGLAHRRHGPRRHGQRCRPGRQVELQRDANVSQTERRRVQHGRLVQVAVEEGGPGVVDAVLGEGLGARARTLLRAELALGARVPGRARAGRHARERVRALAHAPVAVAVPDRAAVLARQHRAAARFQQSAVDHQDDARSRREGDNGEERGGAHRTDIQ